MPLAEVGSSCGRLFLSVAGIAVAMDGDRCRHMLPSEVAEPIPEDELKRATVGGKPCKDMPLDVVRFFRGEAWRKESLEWAAEEINREASKRAGR